MTPARSAVLWFESADGQTYTYVGQGTYKDGAIRFCYPGSSTHLSRAWYRQERALVLADGAGRPDIFRPCRVLACYPARTWCYCPPAFSLSSDEPPIYTVRPFLSQEVPA